MGVLKSLNRPHIFGKWCHQWLSQLCALQCKRLLQFEACFGRLLVLACNLAYSSLEKYSCIFGAPWRIDAATFVFTTPLANFVARLWPLYMQVVPHYFFKAHFQAKSSILAAFVLSRKVKNCLEITDFLLDGAFHICLALDYECYLDLG